jgi:L-ribulose-5-phosphate 3-epimerase UlaE
MDIVNDYKVETGDIKVGKTFFVFLEGEFKQILIGPGSLDICNMYVNFEGKKYRLLLQELWSSTPKDWKGRIKYL